MFSLIILAAGLVAFTIFKLVQNALKPGLRTIPGPFLAKFTDGWRTWKAREGLGNVVMPRLQKQYGNVVRIGPNIVYCSEPGIGERMMNHKANFPKSDSMKVWQAAREGKVIAGIATTQDREYHAQLRRPIAAIYSNTNVLQFEPNVQETNRYFLRRLDEEFIQGQNSGRPCDIDNWVQYYAFDIVGELTLSKRLGFLEEGHDIDGMLGALNEEFAYRGIVQNMPWLDYAFRKNPVYLWLFKPTQRFVAQAMRLTAERRAELQNENSGITPVNEKIESEDDLHNKKVDSLQRFLEAQPKNPIVSDTVLNMYIMTNFMAGSDTTAVTMRSIIYHTLKNPGVLSKLREELDAHLGPQDYPVSHANAITLPYLQAVIWEAMRMHPIGAIFFERILPAEGLTLDSGIKLPGGTVVATTGWTTNFEGSVYDDGVDDVREFHPERWLRREARGESEEAFEKRLSVMKKHDLSFSTGPRGCLGKWIALLEIYTIIPTLFGLLDMEFVSERPWVIEGSFFARQFNMDVRMKWREGVDRTLYV